MNGALRRARKSVADRLPDRSQQATLRALGDDGVRQLVERYIDAWERADVDAILAMLAEDATFAMPPLRTWYHGRDAIRVFLTRFALVDPWRLVPVRANGQLAFGCYAWDAERRELRGANARRAHPAGRVVVGITAFVTPYTSGPTREQFATDVFERFGLPARLH